MLGTHARRCTASVLALAVLTLVTGVGAPARACSPGCEVTLAPLGDATTPARLPTDAAFVEVGSLGFAPQFTGITIERTRAGATETLTLEATPGTLALPDPREGDRLVVTVDARCGARALAPSTTTIALGASAARPVTAGVLDVAPSRLAPVAVWDNRGGCTSDASSAVASYALTPEPGLDAWGDAIVLRPMLDGAPWTEPFDTRVAPHFVFAHCGALLPSQSAQDTTPGEHRLRIDAVARGVGVVASSDEVTFELTCPGASTSGCAVTSRGTGAPWLAALVLARALRRRPDRTVSET